MLLEPNDFPYAWLVPPPFTLLLLRTEHSSSFFVTHNPPRDRSLFIFLAYLTLSSIELWHPFVFSPPLIWSTLYLVSLHPAAGGISIYNSFSVAAVEALISQDPAGATITDFTKLLILNWRGKECFGKRTTPVTGSIDSKHCYRYWVHWLSRHSIDIVSLVGQERLSCYIRKPVQLLFSPRRLKSRRYVSAHEWNWIPISTAFHCLLPRPWTRSIP